MSFAELVLEHLSPDEATSKEDLQAATGLGAEDLRKTLAELEEDGVIRADDDGWQMEIRTPAEEPAEEEPEPEQRRKPGDVRYAASLVLEVSYYPEPREGEAEDAAALREALQMLETAREAIHETFGGLPVAAEVARLDAFSEVRQVYP